jgi:cytochrome c peroxidase
VRLREHQRQLRGGGRDLPALGYHYGLVALNRARNKLFRRTGRCPTTPPRGADPRRLLQGSDGARAGDPRRLAHAQLRDVALTAPYMHDGVYHTLDEVLWHYDQGGTAEGAGSKAPELHPLLLSERDRRTSSSSCAP